jgi:hypothetical protein
LGIEPRIFGFKVNTGGQAIKQPTNFRRKILNLLISKNLAEKLFSWHKVRANKCQTRKTVNFAGFDGVFAIRFERTKFANIPLRHGKYDGRSTKKRFDSALYAGE